MFVAACEELVEKINNNEIRTKRQLEAGKVLVAKKYGLPKIPKNPEILAAVNADERTRKILQMKPTRTISGVANIAVMWLPQNQKDSCPANCVYCAQGPNSPKSYTGTEPATMRAQRLAFDAYLQVENRLRQFHIMGHSTDKCELIVMGGTFMARPQQERDEFIRRAFDSFNCAASSSLQEAQAANETAANRVIGLTLETRADFCDVQEMLRLGCTRVELGVQTADDSLLKKINRGHLSAKNIEAIRRCKEAGLKVCIHWMPGLTGLEKLDMEKEVEDFTEIFSNEEYRPDEIKIYPTLVIPGTQLHEMWSAGKYQPLEKEQMILLLRQMKSRIPEYVRVKRVMRDISEWEVAAGASTTNIRQLAAAHCRCIRCREIKTGDAEGAELKVVEYDASGGKEYFISFEKDDKIIGFLRLRLSGEARIRELHVYGVAAPLSEKGNAQHRGFGRRLLEKAEELATEAGMKKIYVTSGIGVREYYRKFGYERDEYYMAKRLVI